MFDPDTRRSLLILAPLLAVFSASCAVQDSHTAHVAQHRLLGLSEVDLEACLGVPDQHSSFGPTDVLTWYATSSSSTSYSLPIIGGIGLSNGAYCHATFRIDDGHVTNILYSGEKNATLAPDAYCAPIVRTCLAYLATHPERTAAGLAAAPVSTSTGTPVSSTPPGGTTAAPQPGASTAGFAASMPIPSPSTH